MSMARYSLIAAESSARACFPPADLGIQRAEAQVAVGLERAHAEFLGQSEGLAVVGFGRLNLRGLVLRSDVAEEAEGIRLVASFLVAYGQASRASPGQCARLRQAASQPVGFARKR